MAFTGIMCTEAEIDQRSGANVSTSYTDTMKTAAVLAYESMINAVCRHNFSDVFAASLNVDVKYLLTEFVASMTAIQAISYDMSGYTSRAEAESMITVLRDSALRAQSILRDQKAVTFINGA